MAASTASGKKSVAATKERCDALSEVLADHWWSVGLRGILGILFGLICLLTPGLAVSVFVILFSAYMLVDGAFAIAAGIKAARNGERWGLLMVEGLVDIAAGVVAFIWPAITLVALVWLIAIWAIVSGALMLGRGLHAQSRSWPLVARPRRHRLPDLRHPSGHRAADRGGGADHLDRRLCARVRHLPAHPRLPASFAQRGAGAQGAGCGKEGLSAFIFSAL